MPSPRDPKSDVQAVAVECAHQIDDWFEIRSDPRSMATDFIAPALRAYASRRVREVLEKAEAGLAEIAAVQAEESYRLACSGAALLLRRLREREETR